MKLLLLFLLLLLFAAPCLGMPGPLVIILLPGTSLHEWITADAPNLHRIMDTGSLAVMNTRTARLPSDKQRESPESTLLTLGAGARAAAGSDVTVGYKVHRGNLAETLAKAHVSLAVGGGGYAFLIAAASDGHITALTSLMPLPEGCTVWDAGNDVQAADALIGDTARSAAERSGRLIVLSAFVNDKDFAAGRRLAPVLEYGPGIPSGLLVSASTRRPGLVANTDFAPSVAAYFGLKRSDFPILPFGTDWAAEASLHAEAQVFALEAQAYRQGQGMRILPYVALALAAWILLGTVLLAKAKLPIWAAALPLAAALALLLSGSAIQAGVVFAVAAAVASAASLRSGRSYPPIVMAALIVGIIVLDMASRDRLMQRSLLGYSAVEGARYYGIGNEAMGLLVGSVLVAAGWLWPRSKLSRVLTAALFAVTATLLGLPQAGAKAGGLLVASAAFGVFVWESCGGKWSWRTIGFLGMGCAVLLGFAALGDSLLPIAHHSHMGDAVLRIRGGGVGEGQDIIARKLTVEGKLAWHSAWAVLLWVGLVCLKLTKSVPNAGFVAIAMCFLFNDAGVVAAALCLVPLWCDAAGRQTQKKPWEKPSSPRASMSTK